MPRPLGSFSQYGRGKNFYWKYLQFHVVFPIPVVAVYPMQWPQLVRCATPRQIAEFATVFSVPTVFFVFVFFRTYLLSMEQPQMSKSSVFGLWICSVYPSLESSIASESPFRHVKNKEAFVPRPVSCHQRSVHQRHKHELTGFCYKLRAAGDMPK